MHIFLRKKSNHWNRKDKNSFTCILPLPCSALWLTWLWPLPYKWRDLIPKVVEILTDSHSYIGPALKSEHGNLNTLKQYSPISWRGKSESFDCFFFFFFLTKKVRNRHVEWLNVEGRKYVPCCLFFKKNQKCS